MNRLKTNNDICLTIEVVNYYVQYIHMFTLCEDLTDLLIDL